MSQIKVYLLAIACLFVFTSADAQDPTTYTFEGSINNIWTTTGNWTPAYPGVSIPEGDAIVIAASCRASHMSIEIGGGLIINAGQTLYIGATNLNVTGLMTVFGELSIQTGGAFVNSGYSTIESTGSISNAETVFNASVLIIEGSVMNNGNWVNASFGEMQLLSMASFDNANYLINKGHIEDFSSGFINHSNLDNNGELTFAGAFVNAGNLANLSTIFIEGHFSTAAGSNLFNHKLVEISSEGVLMNSGTSYIFSAAQLRNEGAVVNKENGIIFNQGTLTTRGGVNFTLKPGSYLENHPGSVVSVN